MTRPAEVSSLHQPAAHTEETGEDSVLQAGPQDRSKRPPLQVEAQLTQGEVFKTLSTTSVTGQEPIENVSHLWWF